MSAGWKTRVLSRPGSTPSAAVAAPARRASSAKVTRRSGRRRSAKVGPACSRSASSMPSARAARARAFTRTSRAASAIALPPTTAARLANEPVPCSTPAVSPATTVTSAGVTPSSSAATWASVVSSPWPWVDTPLHAEMRPAASTRTRALSKGPTPVSST